MASASNRIGETNDIPAPKPGRGVMSLTHARLEYPRESCFLIFLAFAMSTDAFAAAIGKGSSLDRPRLSEALRTGIIFGVIEAITLWSAGCLARPPASSSPTGITGSPSSCWCCSACT